MERALESGASAAHDGLLDSATLCLLITTSQPCTVSTLAELCARENTGIVDSKTAPTAVSARFSPWDNWSSSSNSLSVSSQAFHAKPPLLFLAWRSTWQVGKSPSVRERGRQMELLDGKIRSKRIIIIIKDRSIKNVSTNSSNYILAAKCYRRAVDARSTEDSRMGRNSTLCSW
ncbi:hypothetical protein VTO42DRAFT_4311 [Malbranchea cinnamomea]